MTHNPRMHTGICVMPIHIGIFQSLTVCIWEIFPYRKSSLVSPYANFPYRDRRMHMGIPMHTGGDR